MTVTETQGYERAAAAPTVGTQLRKSRLALSLVVIFVLLVVIILLTGSDENDTPLSTLNPGPIGAQALAEVARDQGLSLREVDRLSRARITDPANTTLVIADGGFLQSFQAGSIVDYPGDIVVIGYGDAVASALGFDLTSDWLDAGTFTAQCEDPHAIAAETLSSSGQVLRGKIRPSHEGCFEAAPDAYGYVVIPNGDFTVTLIADPVVATNDVVASEGNAALLLRNIGRHPFAVWYVGSYFDGSVLSWTLPSEGGAEGPARPPVDANPDFMPPGSGNAIYGLFVALIAVVLWRARRFGALVTEPLPVVIRSSEATRGRARLYRAAGAHGRAGASLRGAAAGRIGRRLGVSRYDGKDALLNAITRATGRDMLYLENLLYGPPPPDESAMMDLANALDQLESEVHKL